MAFLMRRLPKKPLSEILLGQARTAADPPTAIARSAPAMATSTWFTAPGMLAYLSAQHNQSGHDDNLEFGRNELSRQPQKNVHAAGIIE
jgi:hypothetical protein